MAVYLLWASRGWTIPYNTIFRHFPEMLPSIRPLIWAKIGKFGTHPYGMLPSADLTKREQLIGYYRIIAISGMRHDGTFVLPVRR
ncbi:MAG: hypothetical protein QXP27_03255, partial [Candidatus Methanomethyliaceae archaeon]